MSRRRRYVVLDRGTDGAPHDQNGGHLGPDRPPLGVHSACARLAHSLDDEAGIDERVDVGAQGAVIGADLAGWAGSGLRPPVSLGKVAADGPNDSFGEYHLARPRRVVARMED